MTTQTYIPSEEELKEMGFMAKDSGYIKELNSHFVTAYIHLEFSTIVQKHCFYFTIQGAGMPIYPTDKAHLQSIILAFQPQ